jgi:NAD(P)-dependent dehydrogenase (short-subunit alcohol dehydrogenase family)
MSTAQKSIFITGAASGLGREVARYFANVGWFVGLADIDEKGLDATAALLPKGEYSRHKLDVTDRAQWKKAVAEFAKHTNGHMTVLFNNAGIGAGGPIQEMTDEDIDRMIAINLTGVISGTRACFDLLKNTDDACVLYSATKFAVRGLAEAHDIEWRPYGIKSRSLMPGFIDTNIISNVDAGSNMSGKERLQSAGVEVSPVSIIGPAAWEAIHGEKVHTPVNKMAKQLAFSARWFPNRLRKQLGLLGGLGDVVQTKP